MKISVIVRRVIAIFLVISGSIVLSGSTIAAQLPETQFFKELTNRSYAAWNTQNPEAVAEFFLDDPNLVVFDATPLKYQGWEDFKAGIQTHLFDKLNRFQLTANDDFIAIHNGDLVWTTFTYHLSAETKSGQSIETEGRQTDLWQEHEDKWAIVHEHTSTPVSL